MNVYDKTAVPSISSRSKHHFGFVVSILVPHYSLIVDRLFHSSVVVMVTPCTHVQCCMGNKYRYHRGNNSCEHRHIITYYKLLYAYGCKSLIFMTCYLADMYWQFWLAIDFNLHYTHAKVSCFFKHSSRPNLTWLFDRYFDLNISGLCDT